VMQEMPHGAAACVMSKRRCSTCIKTGNAKPLRSLAIMRFGNDSEWPAVRAIIADYLSRITLPVSVYEDYRPGVDGERAMAKPAAVSKKRL